MRYVVFFIIFVFEIRIYSEITYIPNASSPYSTWETDSLFVGGEILSADSTKPVSVSYQFGSQMNSFNMLCYTNENKEPKIILTNQILDTNRIVLGKFKEGTLLTFCLIFKSHSPDTYLIDKALFTGQNRIGIDEYITEIKGVYNRCWTCIGVCGTNQAEIGFDDGRETFSSLIIKVDNVYVGGINKFKLPKPKIVISDNILGNQDININIATDGYSYIINRRNKVDTISINNNRDVEIYYTYDNSDPITSKQRQLYSTDVTVVNNSTIKAYANYIGDRQWYSSDVSVLESNVTGVKMNQIQKYLKVANSGIFDLLGKHVPYANKVLANGVYVNFGENELLHRCIK